MFQVDALHFDKEETLSKKDADAFILKYSNFKNIEKETKEGIYNSNLESSSYIIKSKHSEDYLKKKYHHSYYSEYYSHKYLNRIFYDSKLSVRDGFDMGLKILTGFNLFLFFVKYILSYFGYQDRRLPMRRYFLIVRHVNFLSFFFSKGKANKKKNSELIKSIKSRKKSIEKNPITNNVKKVVKIENN